ncbi:MAG: prepilin-type N-terminal cleavage/methylation domain-containing protein [Sedimentisphaerales bacterium]
MKTDRRFNSFSLFTIHYSLPSAFTLVEVLIVVAILGILAAIVVPLYEDNQQKAKESAAKENLRVLRNAIELYAAQHKGVPPGYLNSSNPSMGIFIAQLKNATNSSGVIAQPGTDGYPLGPYMKGIPENPFNGKTSIVVVQGSNPIPTATGNSGWIYRPSTKTMVMDHLGTDSDGKNFSTY